MTARTRSTRHRRNLTAIAVAVTVLASMPGGSVAVVTPAIPSDFDGDGYADLAIGVPGEVVGGHTAAGGVNVLYGSPTGITSAGDQFWTQDTSGIPGTSVDYGGFGMALASGDFDRDGFADLVVRGFGQMPASVASMTVINGSANGLAAAGAQLWTEADLGFVLDSDGSGFGDALAAGDFDGDGYTDLAIGNAYRDVDKVDSGAVDIMFGGPDGLSATGALQFSQASPGVPGEPAQSAHFGSAVAAGDFTGDGIDDLAVGVSGNRVGDNTFAGGVSILYGTIDGPTAVGSQLWTQGTPGIIGNPGVEDGFGGSLATGDIDGNGYDDLVIGAPRDKIGGIETGSVSIIYGSAVGLTATGAELWHQGSTGVPGANEAEDDFGSVLAAGDFNSDGADDLAIGTYREDVGRIDQAGVVTVLYGSPSGIRATGARAFSQNTTGVPGTSEGGDRFGYALAVGNYGRSGRDDLAIGAYNERIGSSAGTGVVDVLYGRLSGLAGTGAQAWTQGSPGVKGIVNADDAFGWALTP